MFRENFHRPVELVCVGQEMKQYIQRLVREHLHGQRDHFWEPHAFEICLAFDRRLDHDRDGQRRLGAAVLDIHRIRII